MNHRQARCCEASHLSGCNCSDCQSCQRPPAQHYHPWEHPDLHRANAQYRLCKEARQTRQAPMFLLCRPTRLQKKSATALMSESGRPLFDNDLASPDWRRNCCTSIRTPRNWVKYLISLAVTVAVQAYTSDKVHVDFHR